ncbi:large ribosomal subunit protein P1-like [Rhododendron vialii]|uniref:large ribosomal subunit protein P1-like n=1 Tax=Rhododendron vialii TaxID=182163 RepID=UPI00265E8A89|nr:large ribosomal subunit protein P1-like [Rhododendron vialii]
MSVGELACTYACLALHDDNIPITPEKIAAMVKAANVTIESYWPSLFAKLVEKKNIEDLIMNVGSGGGAAAPVAVVASAAPAAPAAEEEKEEAKEESDEEGLGFSLFDD